MIVGAVDPGLGTGLALYDTDRGTFTSWETYNGVFDPSSLLGCSVVVCERYTITEKTSHLTQQHDALNHIGTLKTFCGMNGIKLVMQNTNAKRFAKPNKLKLLGWELKTTDRHADDAAKHLLNYVVKNKLLHSNDMGKLRKALNG